MFIQYSCFMVLFFASYLVCSLLLVPLAWIVACVDKIKNNSNLNSMADKIVNCFVFIPFGPIILLLDTFCDLIYFWKNNFREDLAKTIIVKEKS